MKKIKWPGTFLANPMAVAVALGCAAPMAQAVNFNIGPVEAQFDSSISVGASWAMQNADPDLVGQTNGGQTAATANDDGRMNFKKGETFSKIFKGSHDLELKYGDTGVFLRGKYWYDFELKDEGRRFKDISDSNRKTGAQSSGAELLDAFVYHNYSIDNLPGSVRLGKQVVSWGESTFIANSINAINPMDVAAFRRPGAEIKEGLIPVQMLFISQGITEDLSLEAFYQLDWEQTVVDNCGTFFGSDSIADGCTQGFTVGPARNVGFALPYADAMGVNVTREGLVVPRGGDRDARDSGQWGLALRWMGSNTEYAAYAMNYHSRLPYLGFTTPTAADIGLGLSMMNQTALPNLNSLLLQTSLLGNSQYFFEYPEDIRLYGLSFSTTLPNGTAWSGEVSYRPNMPLAINAHDATNSPVLEVVNGYFSGGVPGALSTANRDLKAYSRKEVTQAQTTFTHFIERLAGSDRLILVGELGVTQVGGLEHRSERRYGRAAEMGAYADGDENGFFTKTSWGYRARAMFEYSDVFAGINLRPSLAWSHDVDGYGPTFNEGAKAISVGIDADYRSLYTASLSYTDFFGGEYNNQIDRDFLAFSVGMSF